jgi:peroxiredoxin
MTASLLRLAPRSLLRAVAALGLAVGLPVAQAALPVGAAAPDFTAQAAVGGKTFQFSLSQALAQGPVVLYFYPKAFTRGCTVEAHEFAEATDRFKALGATVVGMSNDDIGTLQKFSVEACRNKFAVAADADAKVMKAYDAAMTLIPNTADRISYVIAPDGKVLYVYANLAANGHVENTLKAVERWKASRPR